MVKGYSWTFGRRTTSFGIRPLTRRIFVAIPLLKGYARPQSGGMSHTAGMAKCLIWDFDEPGATGEREDPRAGPLGPGHAADVMGCPLPGFGAGVGGGGRRARARARCLPRRALLEGMDLPRALQAPPRALEHSRGAPPPRLQFSRNRLREAAPGGVPPDPDHLGRRSRGPAACRRRRPWPVTSDSRPVSPCSEPPTKEET